MRELTSGTSELLDRLRAVSGLDANAAERLKALRPDIEAVLPDALEEFYKELRAHPDLVAMFSSEEAMASARGRQGTHWVRIAEAAFDVDYAEAVHRVGKIHADIGLRPDLYLTSYGIILGALIEGVAETRASAAPAQTGFFARPKPGPDVKALGHDAGLVVKAALLDMSLVVATYLEALEARRLEAEAAQERTHREQAEAVREVARVMGLVAQGDLTPRVSNHLPEAFSALGRDINNALASLSHTLASVNDRAATIENAIKTIAASTAELSDRTAQQAASVEESSAVLNQLSASIGSTARDAQTAAGTVSSSRSQAEESGAVVDKTSAAMSRIETSSGEIVKIVALIDEIAFQTTLLALNASVEAARAGESGRGFAVVAQEVRNLAKRCADAAETIKSLVEASASEVGGGVALVSQTGTALGSIIEDFGRISSVVGTIAESAREQATGIGEINSAVNQMDNLIQRNAIMVDETNANLQRLSTEVTALTAELAVFSTQPDAAAHNHQDFKKAG